MAYTRWGAIGEQAGAGLQSGLNAALQQKMKMQQIDQFSKKYGIPADQLALLSLGGVGGKALSPTDQLLQAVFQTQFPQYFQSPQAGQTPSQQPEPQGQPSNNGVDQLMNQEILVIDKATGQKGMLPRSEFDSNLYEMVQE